MRGKRNYLLYLGIFVFTGCTTASIVSKLRIHSIEGKVVDNNGKAIRGAAVSTTPPSSSVLTDDKGSYKIRKLTAGEYTVNVSKTGYADESVTVNLGGYDYPTQADIQLLPESMVVDEPAADISADFPDESKEYDEKSSEIEKKKSSDAGGGKDTTGEKKKWWE